MRADASDVAKGDTPLNGQFNWDSSVFDRSRVADGYLFATHRDRCLYLGKSARDRLHWLKENPGKWRSLEDVEQEVARLRPPVESETNLEAGPAEPNGQTSSHDVRKDGGEASDVTLVDIPAVDSSPPYQPTSLPVPVPAIIKGTTKAELLPPAKAAMRETKGPKTGATPLGAMGRKQGRGGGRQLKKQKLPAEVSKAGRKLSPGRMRVVLECLREYPVLSDAASKAGIHRKTLEYWMKCSEAGNDGYDIEWQGVIGRFHEHCQTAIEEADDKLLAAAWDIAKVYKTDEVLVNLGYEGPDAYLRDENGNPVVETIRKLNGKMIRLLLECLRPKKYGKRRKHDVPQKGGVLVIGDSTKKPENSCAASIRARKWKSRWGMIRKAKA